MCVIVLLFGTIHTITGHTNLGILTHELFSNLTRLGPNMLLYTTIMDFVFSECYCIPADKYLCQGALKQLVFVL